MQGYNHHEMCLEKHCLLENSWYLMISISNSLGLWDLWRWVPCHQCSLTKRPLLSLSGPAAQSKPNPGPVNSASAVSSHPNFELMILSNRSNTDFISRVYINQLPPWWNANHRKASHTAQVAHPIMGPAADPPTPRNKLLRQHSEPWEPHLSKEFYSWILRCCVNDSEI